MTLKRKRSSSELCSSPSSTSSTPSSFGAPSPVANPFNMMRMSSPAHLSSRTLKRFRNSRPSEEQVHERTLGLLYSAQQRSAQLSVEEEQPAVQLAASAAGPTPQQSLHRFWNINSAPSPSPVIAEQPITTPSDCEDCGAALNPGRDEMEVDGYGVEDTQCSACQKHVCFGCSVSNLGQQRRCLQCAGRKTWVGGTEWTSADVSVC